MVLKKPANIERDPFRSEKWDEITRGRNFSESDVPTLALLCQWYAVIERCMSDLDFGDGLPNVAYSNDVGDVKALPQLNVMKQASAEIRQINKQLGIKDSVEEAPKPKSDRARILSVAFANRDKRARAAADT